MTMATPRTILALALLAGCSTSADAVAPERPDEAPLCTATKGGQRLPIPASTPALQTWAGQGWDVTCNPAGAAALGSVVRADPPTDKAPPEEQPRELGQTFCCKSVDPTTGSGTDCTPISHSNETIHLCANVLSCGEKWTKQNGKVVCLD